MSKPLIVPVFIPHFGCPHTCVFCNQKKIAGDYQLPSGQLLEDMVQAYRMSSSSKTREVQLAFYGGSFTGLEEAQQRQQQDKDRIFHNNRFFRIVTTSSPAGS